MPLVESAVAARFGPAILAIDWGMGGGRLKGTFVAGEARIVYITGRSLGGGLLRLGAQRRAKRK